ncbi:MAG: hypothetical protein IJJ64_08240 [Butyrivibrio sp.]|nr:hypothetical protein [Butyrivibrio sp.]
MAKFLTAYAQTKVEDEPKTKNPQSTTDFLSVEGTDDTGVFKLMNGKYSKTYTLSDINFLGSTNDEQKAIITSLAEVMNAIPVRFQITIANEYIDDGAFTDQILFKPRNDKYDSIRADYNEVIKDKLTDAKQGLYQTIYLTLTVEADSYRTARLEFSAIEGSVRAAFISLGVNGMNGSVMKAVTVDERIQKLYSFFHTGISSQYKFSYEKEFEAQRDWLTTISPAAIRFNNEDFTMNGKIGRVMYIDGLPRDLESDMIIK